MVCGSRWRFAPIRAPEPARPLAESRMTCPDSAGMILASKGPMRPWPTTFGISAISTACCRRPAPRGPISRARISPRSSPITICGCPQDVSISATGRRACATPRSGCCAMAPRSRSWRRRSIATWRSSRSTARLASAPTASRSTLKPGTLFVMNPGLRYRKTWSRDAHQLMIKIPRQRLAAHAARPIRFAPVASQMEEADGFVGLIAHLCRDLANARGLERACRPAARDGRSAAFGADCDAAAREHDDAPGYLHRAEAHIRAHAGRSVGMRRT